MGNLDTLKTAAAAVKDLKISRLQHKTALVKTAAARLYLYRTGIPYGLLKSAGAWEWIAGKRATDSNAGSLDTKPIWERAWNGIVRHVGGAFSGNSKTVQDARAEYANSSAFKTPEEREAYLSGAASHGGLFDIFSGKGDRDRAEEVRALADANDKDRTNEMTTGAAGKQMQNIARGEKDMEYSGNQAKRYTDAVAKKMDEMYNTGGLLGGHYGLGPHIGGPASHRPMAFGPFGNQMLMAGQWYPAGGMMPMGMGGYPRGYGSRRRFGRYTSSYGSPMGNMGYGMMPGYGVPNINGMRMAPINTFNNATWRPMM